MTLSVSKSNPKIPESTPLVFFALQGKGEGGMGRGEW